MAYYGGVETGGTWVVCAIGAGPADIVAQTQFPTTEPEPTLARIVDFFRAGPPVRAIGIGGFGPLDLDRRSQTWGYVTTTTKPGWEDTALAPVIRDRLQLPVALDTDVGAAALGEFRWGAGQGARSLCYLTVGTGIGAALVLGGALWHGLAHPEMGHIRVPRDCDADRERFGGVCRFHGDCWEGVASGPAIAARWGAPPERLDEGHPAWALEAEYLALGLLSIILIAGPERIILGGGVLEHESLLERVRHRMPELLAGYLLPALGEGIDSYLVRPRLGDRAGVLGAIALAQTAV